MTQTSIDISESNKNYVIYKFLDEGNFFCGCKCINSKIYPAKKMTTYTLPNGSETARKIFSKNGCLYLQKNDGYLYKIDGNTLTKVTEQKFKNNLNIVNAPNNYGNSILIIDSENSYINGEVNGNIFLPKSVGYYVYQDLMFSFNKNSIYYGRLSYDDFLKNDNFFGRIDIDVEYGDIKGLAVINNILVIISTYALSILSLLSDRKEYTVNKTIALPLAVKDNSVKKVGDELFFIAGKKLYRYSNAKLEVIDYFIENFDYSILDVISFEDSYSLNIQIGNKKYLYIYSSINNIEQIIDGDNQIFSDDGYYFNTSTKELGKINVGSNALFNWQSKSIDFNDATKKNIYQVLISGKGRFNLTITGENKEKQYTLSANKLFKGINIYSSYFSFYIESLSTDCEIDSITIYYRN